MKKVLFSLSTLVLLTLAFSLSSCSKDEPDNSDDDQTEDVLTDGDWVEPYHVIGGNVADAKAYMAKYMKDYVFDEKNSVENSDFALLYYMSEKHDACINYMFDNKRIHMVLMIETKNQRIEKAEKYFDRNYNKSDLSFMEGEKLDEQFKAAYTNKDKSMLILVGLDNKGQWLISYGFGGDYSHL